MRAPIRSFQHNPDGTLTVSGWTPNLEPYAIEITNAVRAQGWAAVLGYTKYTRHAVGAQPYEARWRNAPRNR